MSFPAPAASRRRFPHDGGRCRTNASIPHRTERVFRCTRRCHSLTLLEDTEIHFSRSVPIQTRRETPNHAVEVGRKWSTYPANPRAMRVAVPFIALAILTSTGCGGPSARVTGRITCQGKPVVGVILFSPKGEGTSASAPLHEDGSYELRLTNIGVHTVVVTPRDVALRPKPGRFDYPCDRSPVERDIKAGDNDVTIELTKRVR